MAKINVVLSGSGANFTVHIGALYALTKELAFDINSITCVSGGALIGGLVAAGISLEDLLDAVLRVDLRELIQPVPWWKRLFVKHFYETNKVAEYLKYLTGNCSIKECKYDIAIVTTDYMKCDRKIFTKNDDIELWRAILASMSVPILFPPVKWQGYILRDGAVVNNMPIDIATELFGEPVIGIKVVPPKTYIKPGSWKFELISLIDSFMTALDREHMEENADKVVFVKCGWQSFNFDIPIEVRRAQFEAGRQAVLRYYNK